MLSARGRSHGAQHVAVRTAAADEDGGGRGPHSRDRGQAGAGAVWTGGRQPWPPPRDPPPPASRTDGISRMAWGVTLGLATAASDNWGPFGAGMGGAAGEAEGKLHPGPESIPGQQQCWELAATRLGHQPLWSCGQSLEAGGVPGRRGSRDRPRLPWNVQGVGHILRFVSHTIP